MLEQLALPFAYEPPAETGVVCSFGRPWSEHYDGHTCDLCAAETARLVALVEDERQRRKQGRRDARLGLPKFR